MFWLFTVEHMRKVALYPVTFRNFVLRKIAPPPLSDKFYRDTLL
jgi:hypothetical protein